MKKTDRCYIDIHVLQTVPPSCVNRDDTGSPKTAMYGGVTRARVSSQAWKRAIRLYFGNLFEIGTRTKMIVPKVADAICEKKPDMEREKAEELVKAALDEMKIKMEADGAVKALFFMSDKQSAQFAEAILNNVKKEQEAADAQGNKKKKGKSDSSDYLSALREFPTIDMVLFGRMVAAEPSLNYDAAAQVAHAISTHAVQNEFDYFTAVDDCAPKDNSGAGHIDTTEYNSSTLYRYDTVNVNELASMIPEETTEAVKGFIEAFCCTMPTGKQSSFANRTVPDLVYVTIRNDQPVNFAGAFEKPVRAEIGGYFAPSELALVEYARKTYELFVPAPVLAFGCSRGEGLKELAEVLPLHAMIDRIGDYVENRLKTGDAK